MSDPRGRLIDSWTWALIELAAALLLVVLTALLLVRSWHA